MSVAAVKHSMQRKRQRRQWLEREHARVRGRCHYCRLVTPLGSERTGQERRSIDERFANLDHRIPRSRGGPDHPSNWVLSCNLCNTLKGDMDAEEFVALLEAEGLR